MSETSFAGMKGASATSTGQQRTGPDALAGSAMGDTLKDPLGALTRGPVQLKRTDGGSESGGPSTPPPGGGSNPGPGGAIPYKSEMEKGFGHDFSGVKSFTGRSAEMSSLKAHAATDGSSVMFANANPSKELVAHEMAHVVQSRQADSGALQTKPLVTDGSSPAEREADAAGAAVARGESVTIRETPSARVSRDAYGTLGPVGQKQVDAKAESDYYEAAGQFEIGLGKELSKSSAAQSVSKELVGKIAKMVEAWGKTLGKDLGQEYIATFGTLDPGSSGYVLANVEDIKSVIKEGNLREQLTLVYSAVRGGALGKMLAAAHLEVMFSVQKAFRTRREGNLTTEDTQGFAKKAGIKGHIEKNHAMFENPDGSPKFDTSQDLDGRSSLFNRGDPITREENTGEKQFTGGGAPTGRQSSREREINLSERELRAQLKAQYNVDMTATQAKKAAKKAGLGVEEYLKQQLISQFNTQNNSAYDPANTTTDLTWIPGESWYKAQVDGSLSEKARETKALLRASISGSTDMMMHAAQYLGMDSKKDMEKMRLAMLAWMLPAKDHTFWEIMASAAQFGLNDFDKNSAEAYLAYETAISPASVSYNRAARDYISNRIYTKKDVFPGFFLGKSKGKPAYKDLLATNWLPGSGFKVREGTDIDGWVSKGLPRGVLETMSDNAFAGLAPLFAKVRDHLFGAMSTGATDKDVAQQLMLLPEYTGFAGQAGAGNAQMLLGGMMRYWKPSCDLGDDLNAMTSAGELMVVMESGEREKKKKLDTVDVNTHKELKGAGRDKQSKDNILKRNVKAFTKDVLEFDPKAYANDPDKMNAWFEIMQRRGYEAFMSKAKFEQLQQLNDARKKAVPPQKDQIEEDFKKAIESSWQVNSLTEAEQTAIHQYTISDVANTTNEGIRGKDKAKLKQRLTGSQLILSGMEKMKAYRGGPVYRGDGNRGFEVGKVINYQEFVSTGKTVKSSFINHGNKDWATHAVVIDNHHSGKDLMGFSGYSDANFATIEGEVLFPPGSRFVVTRVVDWTMSYSDMSLDVPQQKIKGDLKRRDQIGQELNNNLAPDQIQKLMDELARIDKRIQDEHPTWKDEVKKANEAAKKSGYSKQKLSKIWVYMNEV